MLMQFNFINEVKLKVIPFVVNVEGIASDGKVAVESDAIEGGATDGTVAVEDACAAAVAEVEAAKAPCSVELCLSEHTLHVDKLLHLSMVCELRQFTQVIKQCCKFTQAPMRRILSRRCVGDKLINLSQE